MKALLLVDIQNDFSPTGSLPVKEGDRIIPFANEMQKRFDLVVASQDWHPADHGSFADNHNLEPGQIVDLNGIDQILWPVHCVQDTFGAEFIKGLDTGRIARVFRKGSNPKIDSYSAFFDNDHRSSTGLSEYLKERGVEQLYIVGLATDYCVKFTALDSVRQGFDTNVVLEGCRGVELNPGDVDRAVAEMKSSGVRFSAE